MDGILPVRISLYKSILSDGWKNKTRDGYAKSKITCVIYSWGVGERISDPGHSVGFLFGRTNHIQSLIELWISYNAL